MFIAALFLIALDWKQPKCPSNSRVDPCTGIWVQWNTIRHSTTRIVTSLQRVQCRREKVANLNSAET